MWNIGISRSCSIKPSIKGDKARLLSVEERTIYLFGNEDIQAPKRGKKKEMKQLTLTSVLSEAEEEAGGWGEMKAPPEEKRCLIACIKQ
jgi:hypothetical protein